jgi:hypothetical protein
MVFILTKVQAIGEVEKSILTLPPSTNSENKKGPPGALSLIQSFGEFRN